MSDEFERKALRAVAVVTVASGAIQVVAPSAILESLSAEDSAATRQLFGTIGMFMLIIGGLSFDGLRRPAQPRTVLLWTGAQKLGAAGAVALGVHRKVFSPVALVVASFDFASGVLALDYRRRLGRR